MSICVNTSTLVGVVALAAIGIPLLWAITDAARNPLDVEDVLKEYESEGGVSKNTGQYNGRPQNCSANVPKPYVMTEEERQEATRLQALIGWRQGLRPAPRPAFSLDDGDAPFGTVKGPL